MRLLSYSKFDITSYYGNLVILYPEGMEAEVKPILSALDNHGYAYLAHSVGPTLVMQGKALLEITELLDTCTCLVPVLSSAICSPEGDITKGMFWYFIGYPAFLRSLVVEILEPACMNVHYHFLTEELAQTDYLRVAVERAVRGSVLVNDPDSAVCQHPECKSDI